MKAARIVTALLLVSVVLGGCIKPVILAPTNEEKTFSPTNAEQVLITTNSWLAKPNVEVGYVFAQGQSLDDAKKLARQKAAEAGGDAIISSHSDVHVILSGFILFIPIYESVYGVHGMVVKYQ
jgi:hypothetical protein